MSEPVLRVFYRADREQLTGLVNAHISSVVPGWAVSAAVLLAHVERDPGQYVTDPWVGDRRTLVAEVAGRVVAAAHVRRDRADPDVGADWRGAGEIAWLVGWHRIGSSRRGWERVENPGDQAVPVPAARRPS